MIEIFQLAGLFLKACCCSKASLIAKNLALHQQLLVSQRTAKRPRLKRRDRIFWVGLSRIWSHWQSALVIVQPETVVRWHRQGFRVFWRLKSRFSGGRPQKSVEVRQLVRQMSRENSTWGAPRIQAELLLLGHDVAQSTVAKYMTQTPKPPSPSWKTLLKNHAQEIAACDFFVVPPPRFGCCTVSWSSRTIDDGWFTLTWPSIPAPVGPRSRSPKRFRSTPRPSISCATTTRSTVACTIATHVARREGFYTIVFVVCLAVCA